MPQFDFTTLSSIIFSALLSSVLYYSFISIKVLSEVSVGAKFRHKLLSDDSRPSFTKSFLPNSRLYRVLVTLK